MLPVCDKPYHKIKENMPLGEELEHLWNYPLTYGQAFQNAVLMDQLCSGHLLYSLVNHAYANRYHHHLVR